MRISTSWAQELGVNAMNAQQVKMHKTQMQLSSGLKTTWKTMVEGRPMLSAVKVSPLSELWKTPGLE